MKSWEALTEAGKLRRLRAVAQAALARYPVRPRRIRLIGGFTNAVFRVDTDRERFALRVDLMQDHSDEDVDVEVAWLEALARETDLSVARVVRARDGARYVFAEADGVPRARRCLLFRWIGGRALGAAPTVPAYERLGRLAAALHLHADDFEAPGRPMRWDRVFYYPASVDPVVIFDEAMAHHFEGGRMRTLERAMEAAAEAFDRRDVGAFRVLHGDLHPWNVHVNRGALTAFDFEDVMWGHPVQDVAITLSYLDDHAEYPAFRAAFQRGYEALAPWPETYPNEIEAFITARRLMFVNMVGRLKPDPSEYYAKTFPKLERFLALWHARRPA